MHDLYRKKCEKEKNLTLNLLTTAILSNIDFHIPKIDRCEKSEGIKIKKNENISVTNEENHLQDLHISEKLAMREEKDKDKLLIKDENYLLVVLIWKM